MSGKTETTVKAILEARDNNGTCKHCGRKIQLYKYKITPAMVYMLKDMGRITARQAAEHQSNPRHVDSGEIDRPFSVRTQMTKLRLHGLVAKVKDAKGKHIPRTWTVTKKGWKFLAGKPVQARVTVYNNTVLGHSGGLCVIDQIAGASGDYIVEPITEDESKQLTATKGQAAKDKAKELGLC
jgi:hypothetical protein|nr:MAG TPA: hypothetical protein [Caudoviricetes sp.]DAX96646.1 MAG TPA: hypothetical protein [Caudoviricetes sp.]DAY10441.1 MAG TPA: hypothetical protein [Caudoviricetes sp.]